jgi:hypothetical protein
MNVKERHLKALADQQALARQIDAAFDLIFKATYEQATARAMGFEVPIFPKKDENVIEGVVLWHPHER